VRRQGILWLTTATLLITSLPAFASELSSNDLAHALEERFDVHLANVDAFSIADLQSLLEGAEALPASLWSLIETPLTIETTHRPCLYGMGRYNDACPTFGPNTSHFYLYESPVLVGETGPNLHVLRPDELRDLQVRRALIHLVMFHVEQALQWSAQPAWRSINGWPQKPGPALNLDPYGYSRSLGMRSAHLDLLTFAEEYFVRPQDLLHGDRLDAVDPDHTLACQHFTKSRVFTAWLAELTPSWAPPPRRLPHQDRGEPPCPAFSEWARPELLEGFDLLLAAPTARRPESLYGHLLLHLRYKSAGVVRGEGFEPVYQFGALTDTDISPFAFFGRGLVGGFPAILELATFRGIDRHFLQYQQRSLHRFALHLDETESLALLERIFEAERRIRYPYAFLTKNCASFLIDLLATVIDPALVDRRKTLAIPTDVLDLLASYTDDEDSPRLTRKSTLRSNLEIAEQALANRRIHFDALHDTVDAPTATRLEELLRGLEDPDPDRRRDAFLAAPDLLDVALREHPDRAFTALIFLYESLLVERYFMELAFFARRTILASATLEPVVLTIAEQLAMRRELFRSEDLLARVEAMNAMTLRLEAELEAEARREFTDRELEVLDLEERIRASYLAALQAQAWLIEEHFPDWDGAEFLAWRGRVYDEQAHAIDGLSLQRSGRHRFALGSSLSTDLTMSLEISYSALEDRLGELRTRGYGPHYESRLLGLDLRIPLHPNGLRELQIDLTLFQYASLRTLPRPLGTGLRDLFGWSLEVVANHDGRRRLFAGAAVTPTLLVPLWTDSVGASHLILAPGLAVRHDIHRAPASYLGASASLRYRHHLFGDFANAFGLHLSTTHYVGPDLRWHFDARSRADVALRVPRFVHGEARISPYIEFFWTTRDYRDEAGPEGFGDGRVGLSVDF
jgi:hypothetical protein